jgi:hypothetical protein
MPMRSINIHFLNPIVVLLYFNKPIFRHTQYIYYYLQCIVKLWETCFNHSGSYSGPCRYNVSMFQLLRIIETMYLQGPEDDPE